MDLKKKTLQHYIYLLVSLTLCITFLPHPSTAASIHKQRHRQQKQQQRLKLESGYVPDALPLKASPIMVPVDLQETPNKMLDPDLDSIDIKEMLDRMGTNYDNRFMSYHQPQDMITQPNGSLHYEFKNERRPHGPMPPSFRIFENRSMKLSDDGPTIALRASEKTRRKLQKFLWAYSYCPVRYKWKELSTRFWPRYIRTGSCDNQRSCSIPAGMTCQPSKISHLKLLRYYCPYGSGGSRNSCTWIKIDYPILTECQCGCQQYEDDEYKR